MSCQTPELYEKQYLSCIRERAELYKEISEGFKKLTFPDFSATGSKGAIGLRRNSVLTPGLNGTAQGERVLPFKSAILERAHVEEIVNQSAEPVAKALQTLLRLTNLVNESVSIEVSNIEPQSEELKSVIHGKLAKKSHIKLFQFHAEKWVKIDMLTPDPAILSLGINASEESALLRLEPVSDSNPGLRRVQELLVFFNERPKLSVEVFPPPKAIPNARQAEFNAVLNSSVPFIPETHKMNATPDVVLPDEKPNLALHHPTLFFLNKNFPAHRYTQRHRPHKGVLPIDEYLGYFAQCTRDLATILYAQAILRAVAAALVREIIGYGTYTWEELVQFVQGFAETTIPKGDIKREVSALSDFVSALYVQRMQRQSTASQLQRLFTELSGLDQSSLHNSHFGHLVTAYAFSNAPIHLVTSNDVRSNNHTAKTKYGEAQKLRINHLSYANDHGWRDHSQRISINVQIKTYRTHFVDLKEIMNPSPDEPYWQRAYTLSLEQPNYNNASNPYALSVKLDAIRLLGLRLDVYHTNVHGTEIVS